MTARFLQAYLIAYIFWLGIALGCQAILMVHHLAGGRWGFVARRLLEAASRTLPLLAALFLPVLIGLSRLYGWVAQPVEHNRAYLNVPFFVVRVAIYFAVWLGTMLMLDRAATIQDEKPNREATRRLTIISGVGLGLYALTMTFASIDWMMSLEPHWFSTIYGVLVMTGQVLGAFAFVILAANRLAKVEPQQFHDLGNFLLTFVIFWAYIAFSQFLIIWSGNLTEENPWYLRRLAPAWKWLAVALLVLHFFVPFLLLLSREMKRRSPWLSKIALGVFVMCFVDVYWIIAPAFSRPFHWMDVVAPVGIGALWVTEFRRQFNRRSPLPAHDSRVEEELEWA